MNKRKACIFTQAPVKYDSTQVGLNLHQLERSHSNPTMEMEKQVTWKPCTKTRGTANNRNYILNAQKPN